MRERCAVRSEPLRRVAVIGGGVAGLSAAFHLEQSAAERGLPLAVSVFEHGARPGGKLTSQREDGYVVEWGPNGFLDSEPATLRLVARLGLDADLRQSSDAARHRFLLIGGRLRELPLSPPAFLKSDILPLSAKLRMAGELFLPARPADALNGNDESIDAFGRRRLGARFAETLLDPMVKGVFGGDSRRLSLAACFPRMVELESRYGGLIKAMFKLQRERKRNGARLAGGGAGGPSGVLHSFAGGMQTLVEALAGALQGELHVNAGITRVSSEGGAWYLDTSSRRHGPFDALLDASPAHRAARHQPDEALASELAGIRYAPMAVVTLAYDAADVAHALDGFGMLVPTSEQRRLLGVLWSASIFPDRAPAGKKLLRCMAGGAGDPRILDLDDRALVDLALSELRHLYGLRGNPERVWVIRHARAIAQYEVGHAARLARIDGLLAKLPGLWLAGSSYRGVSVNHCVAEAERVSEKILSWLGASGAKEEGRASVASLL